ncbi:hypothetical protein O1611_g4864 [Lasiodiplodia mahajangana]|uniref:Uncharacterized protein n=1 Tax=Lasiodiplodia mahajangana TaxID=1108764 RepID=A0ACC2JMT3_9PEZI|nr:hypothetical protein O1611_g4864 [Lasiodiplodia mahajangana]
MASSVEGLRITIESTVAQFLDSPAQAVATKDHSLFLAMLTADCVHHPQPLAFVTFKAVKSNEEHKALWNRSSPTMEDTWAAIKELVIDTINPKSLGGPHTSLAGGTIEEATLLVVGISYRVGRTGELMPQIDKLASLDQGAEQCEFPPYNDEKDPLLTEGIKYTDVEIQWIPPSRDKEYSTDQLDWIVPSDHSMNSPSKARDKETIISKLNGFTEKTTKDDLLSCIRDCHALGLRIEINRLARFAICRNAMTVLECLVDLGVANLQCLDMKGRSAILYALWDYPGGQMIEYVADLVSLDNVDWDRDIGPSAFEHAVYWRRLDAMEHLRQRDVGRIYFGRDEPWYTHSLLGYKDLIAELHFITIEIFWPKIFFRMELPLGDIPFPVGESPFRETLGKNDTAWVHLPWANGVLFFFALRKYGRMIGYPTFESDWLPSLFQQPVKVPVNLELPYTDPVYESNFGLATELTKEDPRSFMIFPCLVLRTQENHNNVRGWFNFIRTRLTDRPVQSLLEPELTLDESYFPSLQNNVLQERNRQQVVSREYRKPSDQESVHNGEPVLLVPKLWLWRCGRYILTAFSSRFLPYPAGANEERPAYEMSPSGTSTMASPGIQTGLFIAHHISEFGKPQAGGRFPSPLDIFEASAARVLTDVNQYMKQNTLSPQDMEEEQGFMFRIADIREELVMIQNVLQKQFEVLQAFIEDFEHNNPDSYEFLDRQRIPTNTNDGDREPLREANGDGEKDAIRQWEEVKRSRHTIKKYQERTRKIDRDAEMVERRIQDQLNLKRTYASIRDARTSVTLGIAVIGFTVITIIFAPLAFVTALFALPIDSLLQNQFTFKGAQGSSEAADELEPTRAYTTRYVGTWFAVAEVATLVVTILLVVFFLYLPRHLNGAGSSAPSVAESGSAAGYTGSRRRVLNLGRREMDGFIAQEVSTALGPVELV